MARAWAAGPIAGRPSKPSARSSPSVKLADCVAWRWTTPGPRCRDGRRGDVPVQGAAAGPDLLDLSSNPHGGRRAVLRRLLVGEHRARVAMASHPRAVAGTARRQDAALAAKPPARIPAVSSG